MVMTSNEGNSKALPRQRLWKKFWFFGLYTVKKNADEVESARPEMVMTAVRVFSPIVVLTKP